jgi:hypothetical protein
MQSTKREQNEGGCIHETALWQIDTAPAPRRTWNFYGASVRAHLTRLPKHVHRTQHENIEHNMALGTPCGKIRDDIAPEDRVCTYSTHKRRLYQGGCDNKRKLLFTPSESDGGTQKLKLRCHHHHVHVLS